MTDKGKQFVEQIDKIKVLMANGFKPFPAFVTILEDDDWLLVFAAVCAMAEDIKKS